MDKQVYEYRGLLARTWDLFRGDTSNWEDRFFFLEFIQKYGDPTLDVGCGTGRLLLDFLGLGIDIDGVDLSPEMLALCRQKAARMGLQPVLHEQPIEALALPCRYRTIIVPSSSFQLLLDPATASQAMGRLYEHLEPGGWLAMPFMTLWQPGDPLEADWALSGEAIDPEDGATMRRWSKTRFDPDTALEHTEDLYEAMRDGEVVESEHHRRSPATRSYALDQAMALYQEAGFVELQALSGFTWEPVKPDDTIFTVLGRSCSP